MTVKANYKGLTEARKNELARELAGLRATVKAELKKHPRPPRLHPLFATWEDHPDLFEAELAVEAKVAAIGREARDAEHEAFRAWLHEGA